jgi:hypothetical protein
MINLRTAVVWTVSAFLAACGAPGPQAPVGGRAPAPIRLPEAAARAEILDITDGWRFLPDPKKVSESERWFAPGFDDGDWAVLTGARTWEEQKFRDYDGWAVYRKKIAVPAAWKDKSVFVSFRGVDDLYVLYVNGQRIVQRGKEPDETVWNVTTVDDIGAAIKPGEENLIALRVLDWGMAGGFSGGPLLLANDRAALDDRLRGIVRLGELPQSPPGIRDGRPALAVDGEGTLWMAFERFQNGAQHIYVRHQRKGETEWSEAVRVSEEGTVYNDQPSFKDATLSGANGVGIAWRSKGSSSCIVTLLADVEIKPWLTPRPPMTVLAAAMHGTFRIVIEPPNGTKVTTAPADGAHAWHPSTAIDRDGRVWMVSERLEPLGDAPHPAKETTYRFEQRYHARPASECVFVWDGRRWLRPPPGPKMSGRYPVIHIDREGGVWLFSRDLVHPWFSVMAQRFDGTAWTEPVKISGERNGLKEPVAVAEVGAHGRAPLLVVAWQTDHRTFTGMDYPAWSFPDGPASIAIERIPVPEGRVAGYDLRPCGEDPGPPPVFRPPLPAPYETEIGGQKHRVYFGDLHSHSEISICGRSNGSLEDRYRFARDLWGLDFVCVSDHGEHHSEQDWLRTRMMANRYNSDIVLPPSGNRGDSFVVFPGFEWTSEFLAGGNLHTGHLNVVYATDGPEARPASASHWETNTPSKLWSFLRRASADGRSIQNPTSKIENPFFTFPHHTARLKAPYDWSHYDPEAMPLFEIAQSRGSYEHAGAPFPPPLLNDLDRIPGHDAQDALRRGFRCGFIASGDHHGRQLAAVFAPEKTRAAIFEGLAKKRTYGTTGARIFLDVRVDGHFMGEEFQSGERARRIEIRFKGERPVAVVDLWKNGRILKSWGDLEPDRGVIEYVDHEPFEARENWYYVRLTQADGQMAWSSPTWWVNPAFAPGVLVDLGDHEPTWVLSGAPVDVAVLLRNQKPEPASVKLRLAMPEGWNVEPETIETSLPPDSWRTVTFRVVTTPDRMRKLEWVEARLESEVDGRARDPHEMVVIAVPRPLHGHYAGRIMERIHAAGADRAKVNAYLAGLEAAYDLERPGKMKR